MSEILIVLLVLLVAVVPVALLIVIFARAGAHHRAQLARRTKGPPPPMPPALQEQVRDLYLTNIPIQKTRALKLIRQHTGVSLREAQMIANALAAGLDMPSGPASPPQDLASRVRALKASGCTEQAVFLVRGETGIGQSEAEAFIATL